MLTAAEIAHMRRVAKRHDIVVAIEAGHLVAPEDLAELRVLSLPIATRRQVGRALPAAGEVLCMRACGRLSRCARSQELEQELQNGHLLSSEELAEFRLYCDAFGEGTGAAAGAAPAAPKSAAEVELDQTKVMCAFVAKVHASHRRVARRSPAPRPPRHGHALCPFSRRPARAGAVKEGAVARAEGGDGGRRQSVRARDGSGHAAQGQRVLCAAVTGVHGTEQRLLLPWAR